MSTIEAALIVAAVLGFSLPAAYWQIRRAQREESVRDRLVRLAHERAESAAALDDLELLWGLPAFQPGNDRLRQAVRDEQQNQKGDQ